jgi:hypothetical protein
VSVMPNPAVDYDAVTLFGVNPQGIIEHAKKIEESATVITESLGRIIATLDKLELGWAGKSAQEAEDFGNRWVAVGKELYGPPDNPQEGALNIVLNGVYTVAYLFAVTEHGIADFFDQISVALLNPGSGGNGRANIPPASDSINNTDQTAITENWPENW